MSYRVNARPSHARRNENGNAAGSTYGTARFPRSSGTHCLSGRKAKGRKSSSRRTGTREIRERILCYRSMNDALVNSVIQPRITIAVTEVETRRNSFLRNFPHCRFFFFFFFLFRAIRHSIRVRYVVGDDLTRIPEGGMHFFSGSPCQFRKVIYF